MLIKMYLISFYYLLEIIKLRESNYDSNMKLNKLNNIVTKYNNIITPYKAQYNKKMGQQEKKTKKVKMKPIGIDFRKICEKLEIDYDLMKNVPGNQIFQEISKIMKKRYQRKIDEKTKEINVVKPVVKI